MSAIKPSYKSVLLGAGSVICLHPEPISFGGSRNVGTVVSRFRNAHIVSARAALQADAESLQADIETLYADFALANEQKVEEAEALIEHG